MQLKKRAKPVKFGKKEKEPEKPKHEVEKAEPVAHKQKEEPEPQETTIEITSVTTEIETSEVVPEEEIPEEAETTAVAEEEPLSEEEEKPKEVVEKELTTEEIVGEPKEEEVEEIEINNSTGEETDVVEESAGVQSAFSNSTFESETETKKNFFLYFIIIAFVAFLIGLGAMAGVNYALQSKSFDFDMSNMNVLRMFEPTPTPTPEPTATPVPTKAVDLSAYTIRVENGSGITGEAAKLKTQLVNDEFTVASTGNADNSDYKKTTISVKENVDESYIKKLRASLEKTYTLGDDTKAPPSQKTDVVITIGSTKE